MVYDFLWVSRTTKEVSRDVEEQQRKDQRGGLKKEEKKDPAPKIKQEASTEQTQYKDKGAVHIWAVTYQKEVKHRHPEDAAKETRKTYREG